jgi:Uma2 family endonuclease
MANLTPEQYLEIERKAEFKSEYYNGEIFAMLGGSRWHDWIAFDLTLLLGSHLKGRSCQGFTADMRIMTPTGLYTYPDLAVTCEEPQFLESDVDTLTNPMLLVEILSQSTEGYDLGRKAEMYRTIPSLRELVLIAQDRYHVALQRRQPDGGWKLFEADGLDSCIEMASISYTLRLGELYETVAKRRG